MVKRNKKHEKRVKSLVFVSIISAIILTVSTYAWFIGMQTVSVNAFEVNIAAAEGLALSVDGVTFGDSVTINGTEANQTAVKEAYSTNTNSWTDLKPISTIGEMDSDESRMVIYEKSSLTATTGGYRLLSEVLDNTTDGEADGYVVFDLFVKNLSGEKYYATNDEDNEEAIYMTLESNVSVGASGVKNTGIENSVRVAFAQIGRVQSNASTSVIQGITCSDDSVNKVTGICRTARIWEPNDTKHIDNAISWYNNSCKKRTAATTYSGECTTITDGEFYETYAVANTITENEEDDARDYEIDVYDGVYNSFNTSVGTEKYLYNVKTLTDSDKVKTGYSRPTFMTLAPNSITKVRVYIYIEGQDVDNYDFASLGKAIQVNFGFTKERFYAEDFGYDSSEVPLDEDLYRYYRITYAETDTISGLPEGVTHTATTDTLTIPRTMRESFEFKDGDKTIVASPVIAEDGTIDWTAAEK